MNKHSPGLTTGFFLGPSQLLMFKTDRKKKGGKIALESDDQEQLYI